MLSVYIANLAKYNNGELFGKWLNLSEITEEELQEAISEILGKDEELFISDYEWSGIDIYDIPEFGSITLLKLKIDEIAELSEQDQKKLRYMIKQEGYTLETALTKIDDCDIYENMDLKGLAENLVEEGIFGEIPENIKAYLDYEKIARDLSYDYSEYKGDIFRI
jgi:antirestriction protein